MKEKQLNLYIFEIFLTTRINEFNHGELFYVK